MAKKKKDDEEAPKKGMGAKLKPVLAIVAAVAGYKFFLAPKPVAPAAAAGGVAAAAVSTTVVEGSIVEVPDMVLNLAGPEQHYLRVSASLVLEKGIDPKVFAEEVPIAADVLVSVLSEKTPEDLAQPGAKADLKTELSEKVREAYDGKKVIRVLFRQFVTQ